MVDRLAVRGSNRSGVPWASPAGFHGHHEAAPKILLGSRGALNPQSPLRSQAGWVLAHRQSLSRL